MNIRNRLQKLERKQPSGKRYFVASPIEYDPSNGYNVVEAGKPDDRVDMSLDEFRQWQASQSADVMVYILEYRDGLTS